METLPLKNVRDKGSLAIFNGIDLRMNGWNSEAPGVMVKSNSNGRGSILGLIPGRRGEAWKVRWPNPLFQCKIQIPALPDSNAGI
jgi:hypothetical protein